jgi:peptidoglycan glycosyltransferase
MRPETARQVRQIMIAMAQNQPEVRKTLPGLIVGGKTGTAEVGNGLEPHAWFIGFAEAKAQTIAIAVVVEHGGRGGEIAAPIFAQVTEAAARYLGEPANESVPAPTDP